MVSRSILVNGISNAMDGLHNNMIRCANPDMMIAFGLDKSAEAVSGSESEDPFDSDGESEPHQSESVPE